MDQEGEDGGELELGEVGGQDLRATFHLHASEGEIDDAGE